MLTGSVYLISILIVDNAFLRYRNEEVEAKLFVLLLLQLLLMLFTYVYFVVKLIKNKARH